MLGPGPQVVYAIDSGGTCTTVDAGPSYLLGDPLHSSAFVQVDSISHP